MGAFSSITSPLGCGSPLFNTFINSVAWSAGDIAPGQTVSVPFPGFTAAAVPGLTDIWVAINYLCGVVEPTIANNQKLLSFTV
ncbi:hypothetical protein MNEG_12562 [Monoraphidium neglectum]|uniref:Uncharacterized protein n=1 Tax=Monoraphidium neglectum TaxID=145388 RepID=A0A0D2M1S2_9CHLO|nr:hypothetical protein MNEG_12562 [Monoraphidium neglectum]KIY95401.1 hypothetical protein MNEG_12562 [Monoraphidium neglectum]|eukprot:XP_013894421.1 hypothetical protein MNEG_12562 [Monoraphidium neglectum]